MKQIQQAPKPRRIKKPAELKVKCWICKAPAADHIHYGAVCCYSCRAFFRRSGTRIYNCKAGSRQCEVTSSNRKFCKLCRYDKCLSVGMRPELVDVNIKREDQDVEEEEVKMMSVYEVNEIEYGTEDSPKLDLLVHPREGELSKRLPLNQIQKVVRPRETKSDIEQIDHQINERKGIETLENTCRKFSVISYCSQKSDQEQIEPIKLTIDDSFEQEDEFEKEKIFLQLQGEENCSGSVDNAMLGTEAEEIDGNIVNFEVISSGELIPFKKRERVKEWLPYCHTLSMQGEPSIGLTSEELLFINKRVTDTRELVFLLHDKCMKFSDEMQDYKSTHGFEHEREHCLDIFRANAGDIFNLDIPPDDDFGEVVRRRFFCCSMAAIAVRMFGGHEVDCFPHNSFFYQKYSFLLQSPWASSLDQEQSVEDTLRLIGLTIGSDKRLEVLFTSAIMRGFRDDVVTVHSSTNNDLSTVRPSLAQRLPDLLTGTQFSLLLHRYLKYTRVEEEARDIFGRLASLVPALYRATNTFYLERLKI